MGGRRQSRQKGRRLGRADRGEMQLSATAEYALRAMSHLAALPPGASARSVDLEAATGASGTYLAKVLRKLVVAGLLSSQKGHHGGFVLARPPDRIRFLDVIEAVGHRPDGARCAFGWGACDAAAPCPLHDAWSELKASFSAWATATTLADTIPGARHPEERSLRAARAP